MHRAVDQNAKRPGKAQIHIAWICSNMFNNIGQSWSIAGGCEGIRQFRADPRIGADKVGTHSHQAAGETSDEPSSSWDFVPMGLMKYFQGFGQFWFKIPRKWKILASLQGPSRVPWTSSLPFCSKSSSHQRAVIATPSPAPANKFMDEKPSWLWPCFEM